MKKLLTPVKVGLLTAAALAGLLFALRSVQEGAFGRSETYQVYAVLHDVLGLAKRSRVVMAGIEVGYIEGIELAGERARLNLRIRRDVILYRDAGLAKVSESLLGDKIITLSPGNDTAHPMPEGGQILDVYEEKDISEVFRTLDTITTDIGGVTGSLRKVLDGMAEDDALGGVMKRMNEIADNVARLTQQVNDTVTRGSERIEQILGDVAGVTSGTRERYAVILDNIRDVTADVKKLVGNLNDIVGQGETDWKESVGGLKETLQKASRSLDNLDNITRKINEGQGTLGRLVNDDKVLEKAESVLDDASQFTSALTRLRMDIDLRSEFHVRQGQAKNYLALQLFPKTDKYYMIEVIDDPRGEVTVKSICTAPNVCRDEITVTDDFKFSVQFAKRYYWLGLRFGIIENTGGIGANLYLLHDDLEFKFDLFQFGKNEFGEQAYPRFKAMLMYQPSWLTNHIYLTAGADDPFNYSKDTFDYFFGAGLHFTDDDLKAIFTATGVPSL